MFSEDEPKSAGGGESDWVDETCGGDQEELCEGSPHAWRSAKAAHPAVGPRVKASSAYKYSVAAAASSFTKQGAGTHQASLSAVAGKKTSAAPGAAAVAPSQSYRGASIVSKTSLARCRSRRHKNYSHTFRCKGFTFEWGDDDAAEIPAYDLSPSFKLLRLSLGARVEDAPADILRSFLRAFEAADASARTDLAAGGSLPFHVDPEMKAGESSEAAAAERAGGRGNHKHLKNEQQTALEAAYFAPLGDELYVGKSPQRLQLLSPNRFLGTLCITASSSFSTPASAPVKAQVHPSAATTSDDNEGGADDSTPAQVSLADWEREPSFVTWHRMRVIGADPSAAPSGGAPEAREISAEKEEVTLLSFAEEDDGEHGKKVKKKKKNKQEPSEA